MKILIVEDDDAIAQALGTLLEAEGYRPVRAPDGRTALAELRSGERASVILLDMTMPGMNGWQFREEQLKDDALAWIPILVCTASARAEEDARRIGAAGWLRKPIDPTRLLEAIGECCHPGQSTPDKSPGAPWARRAKVPSPLPRGRMVRSGRASPGAENRSPSRSTAPARSTR